MHTMLGNRMKNLGNRKNRNPKFLLLHLSMFLSLGKSSNKLRNQQTGLTPCLLLSSTHAGRLHQQLSLKYIRLLLRLGEDEVEVLPSDQKKWPSLRRGNLPIGDVGLPSAGLRRRNRNRNRKRNFPHLQRLLVARRLLLPSKMRQWRL